MGFNSAFKGLNTTKRIASAESGGKRKHFAGLVGFEASLAQCQQKY